MLLKKNTLKNP